MRFLEKRFGHFFRLEPLDLAKPRDLSPPEKIALERKDLLLTQKAQSRDPECWAYNCRRKACYWVREVCFDFKGPKAAPVQHAAISSADYPGPVPGFCAFCVDAPRELAETVYRDRPEVCMGALPERWWVVMTDGLITGGECAVFSPIALPNVVTS